MNIFKNSILYIPYFLVLLFPLILQDFEGVTANTLCRVMETVEGGGAIVLLLSSINSLKQLYTLSMDVHARYRTHAHQKIVPRFNERYQHFLFYLIRKES